MFEKPSGPGLRSATARAVTLRLESRYYVAPAATVNARHPDSTRIEAGTPEPLEWDPRFFGIPAPTRRQPMGRILMRSGRLDPTQLFFRMLVPFGSNVRNPP